MVQKGHNQRQKFCFFFQHTCFGDMEGRVRRKTEAKRETSGDTERKSLAARLDFGVVPCYLCGFSSLPASVFAGTYTCLCVHIEKYVCACV